MDSKEEKVPFNMEFGGEVIKETILGNLYCSSKNALVYPEKLIDFMNSNPPEGKKYEVGVSRLGIKMLVLQAWRDEDYVHIGCLKEKRADFNSKYVQLIKHLNNK